jgi:AcrR family transcriptional regulator
VPRTINRSQRERLVDAMVKLSTHGGYHKVSIAELCSFAGVSPVTFYEHFESKEDCFLASYRQCGELIFGRIRALATESDEWSDAARRALGILLERVQNDADAGRVLFIQALGGGPLIRKEHARVHREFESGVEQLLERAPAERQTLDVPPIAVIGALRVVISRHLRTHSEDRLPSLLEDGIAWLSSYAVSRGAERWSTSPRALIEVAQEPPPPSTWTPETLPTGTHGLPAGSITRSQRARLIGATVEVMAAKGYAEAKISDIVAAARVARTVFSKHFADKEDVFLEAHGGIEGKIIPRRRKRSCPSVPASLPAAFARQGGCHAPALERREELVIS